MSTDAYRTQQGAALIIGLIFLLLMTIIGSVAVRSTSLDERMAGNLRNNNLAFQAAEAALREGESNTIETLQEPNFLCDSPPDPDDDSTWVNKHEYSGSLDWDSGNTLQQPVYVIEEIFAPLGPGTGGIYRVTAKGFGADSNAVAVLQSIVGIW